MKRKYRELYRHFDKNGCLLYIGISISTLARLLNHRTTSNWSRRITTIRIERFDTMQQALAAEKRAILIEKPIHNKLHNQAVEVEKARSGRPRFEDRHNTIEARKPWLEEGISRRTWYYRLRKLRDLGRVRFVEKKGLPQ